MNNVNKAISIIDENTKVLYGVFGIINGSGYFPPLDFLNEFFIRGSDPCDQDSRMGEWHPFSINADEYEEVKSWWMSFNEGAIESNLNCKCWDDWVQEILNI